MATRTTRSLIGGTAQRIARGTKRLSAKAAKGSIKAKRGIGRPGATSANGIASPLTEIVGRRTFHATARELRSSDGLFVLQYYNVKQMAFRDAANRTVVFDLVDYVPA